MRVTVLGCGYLGAVHAPCMADLGHDVTGVDVDEVKVKELSAGRAPFYEAGLPALPAEGAAAGRPPCSDPGVPELRAEAAGRGRLRFTADVPEVARPNAEGPAVHFICVG